VARRAQSTLPRAHGVHPAGQRRRRPQPCQQVAAALDGVADSIRVVTLPDVPPGGDVSDWLDAGGDGERLIELCRAAGPWQPDESGAFADVPSDALLPYCEEALTLAFSDRHADDLRYCDVFGRWFEWEAGCWRESYAGFWVTKLVRRRCEPAFR
jgi:putative DNA primase/helicase